MATDCWDIKSILMDQLCVIQRDLISPTLKKGGPTYSGPRITSYSLNICWTWTGMSNTDGVVVNIKISEAEETSISSSTENRREAKVTNAEGKWDCMLAAVLTTGT